MKPKNSRCVTKHTAIEVCRWAMTRAIDQATGVQRRMIELPGDVDPDEYIQRLGPGVRRQGEIIERGGGESGSILRRYAVITYTASILCAATAVESISAASLRAMPRVAQTEHYARLDSRAALRLEPGAEAVREIAESLPDTSRRPIRGDVTPTRGDYTMSASTASYALAQDVIASAAYLILNLDRIMDQDQAVQEMQDEERRSTCAVLMVRAMDKIWPAVPERFHAASYKSQDRAPRRYGKRRSRRNP